MKRNLVVEQNILVAHTHAYCEWTAPLCFVVYHRVSESLWSLSLYRRMK